MQKQQNKFEVLQMLPQNTNSVLVSGADNCVIFDAWGRASDWAKELSIRNLKLAAVYSTHGHSDHISAAPELARMFNVNWYLHADDFYLIGAHNGLLDYFGLPHISMDVWTPTNMPENAIEILPGLNMQIIHTPGHTPGGVMFWFPDRKILLSGDTIFSDDVGRYDLSGGNRTQLLESVHKIYNMNMPDETNVIHGHGINSTIQYLKMHNPWFRLR